jgi:large subunit ribosomal protein L37Ae
LPRKDKSLKGLGQKYGATVRKRYSRVMRDLKAKRRCPSCGSTDFRRQAAGVWLCGKCGFKAAGGAYSFE